MSNPVSLSTITTAFNKTQHKSIMYITYTKEGKFKELVADYMMHEDGQIQSSFSVYVDNKLVLGRNTLPYVLEYFNLL